MKNFVLTWQIFVKNILQNSLLELKGKFSTSIKSDFLFTLQSQQVAGPLLQHTNPIGFL